MRRNSAPGPIGRRRRIRRRRRAIAPAAPSVFRRGRLRRRLLPLTAFARAIARRAGALGHHLAGSLASIRVRESCRELTARGWSACTRFFEQAAARLIFARRQLAGPAARFYLACHRVAQRIAHIRLPEIPGRDPVIFGTAVGIAVIAFAGLVVLVGHALRDRGPAPQDVAVVTADRPVPGPDRRPTAMPEWTERSPADFESQTPPQGRGLTRGIVEPAPGVPVARDGGATDEDENLAAALPLLDLPDGRHRDGVARGPERPPSPDSPYRHDGQPPVPSVRPQWLANAVETEHVPGRRPMVSIVIDDAGVAQARTARAIELPAPLTIAFIPYSRNLEQQTRQARENGHELLLHIPMEPGSDTVDPGPNALLTTLDEDEIMRRFRWALSQFDGYVGVNNHMGSKFMARADLVEPLLTEMNARGLMFLDSRTDSRTVGAELARGMELPHASRQVFLDNELDADSILAQLAVLERVARQRGHAIAIGHPHDVTVDVLAEWIPAARARGLDLVPVSAIVKLEYGADAGSQLAAAAGSGKANGLLGSPQ